MATRKLHSIGASILIAVAGMTVASAPVATAHAQATENLEAKRDNLVKLVSTPITLQLEGQRIEDVLSFLADVTGAEMEPIYIDDRNPEGIDPETLITLNVRNLSALQVLERVLRIAERGEFSEFTWQMTPWGSVEIGPKPVLNRSTRIEIYDIADLLFEIEDFDNFAQIDLDSVLQASQGGGGGGGGGQSPFDDNDDEDDENDLQRIDRANELMDLILASVDPLQWEEFGIDMRYYDPIRSLLVTAPDYLHRQLIGYTFLPAELQQVSLNGPTQFRAPAYAQKRPVTYEFRNGQAVEISNRR